MDDGSSPEITLLIPFIFFNVPYRSIYVSYHYRSTPRTDACDFKDLKPFSAHRSTTMASSLLMCKSASSRQRLSRWATAAPLSRHFGQMYTTGSVATCTTERPPIRKYWRGQHKMSGNTSKTCPPLRPHGSSSQHGTKSPSMEEVRQLR